MASQQEPAPERIVLGAERTLLILNSFLESSEPQTLTDLEQRTGLFKSVICRYMLSFEKHGYVIQRPDGRFQLGAKAFQLGNAYERSFHYADFVLPVLRKLADVTGESTAFFVRQDGQRVCLYSVESKDSVKATVRPGAVFPLDLTSSAQVLKFFSEPDALARAGNKFVCVSGGINNALSASMSAPVFGGVNLFLGSLTIFGLSVRFDPFEMEEVRRKIIAEAAALSTSLGAPNVYAEASMEILIRHSIYDR